MTAGVADIVWGMSIPDLDQALAIHDLNVDDLPGIREAWAAAFAALGGPEIETVGDVAHLILGDLDVARHRGGPDLWWAPQRPSCTDDLADEPREGLRPVLVLRTRQGLGNREHDHEGDVRVAGCSACSNEALAGHSRFLCDFDDDFDGTYAWHVFTIPGEFRARIIAAADNASSSAKRESAARLAGQVMAGEVPPWSLLASSKDHADLEALVRENRPGGEYTVKLSQAAADRASREIAVLDGTVVAGPVERRVAELGEKARAEATSRAMVERARVVAAADPDLAAWLFSVKSTGMKVYTVGTGRSRRTERYEGFDRGPLAEVEEKLSRSTYEKQAADRREELVAEVDAANARLVEEARRAVWAAETMPLLRWRLGWPGDVDRCPAPTLASPSAV